jgi:hypothetical protein
MSLTKMFEDCFAHLGKEAQYQSSGSAPFPIRVLIKQPDTAYEMGDGQVIGHMAIFEVRIRELPFPKVGDQLIIAGNRYKIFAEPLRDASNTIWEITAMVMEG